MAIFSGGPKSDLPPTTPSPPPARRRTDGVPLSIVAQDMTVVGDMETTGVVKVEGRIRGSVKAAAQVFVAEGAVVEGDIYAREAVIGGEVRGGIHAEERVELQATALVQGDISTRRIAILEGGRLSGEVRMDTQPAPAQGSLGVKSAPVKTESAQPAGSPQ